MLQSKQSYSTWAGTIISALTTFFVFLGIASKETLLVFPLKLVESRLFIYFLDVVRFYSFFFKFSAILPIFLLCFCWFFEIFLKMLFFLVLIDFFRRILEKFGFWVFGRLSTCWEKRAFLALLYGFYWRGRSLPESFFLFLLPSL